MKENAKKQTMSKQQNAVSVEPIAIDLGLPSGTLWCDRNVGATSPEDDGAYFSWGNTEPHYAQSGLHEWGDDAFDYNFYDDYDNTEGAKLTGDIDLAHDAARVNMGAPWHMPTSEQFQELYDNCTWERKIRNNVSGYLVTSKINGNSVFFSCSGYGTSRYNRGSHGCYWSSSFYSSRDARSLDFNSGGVNPQYNYYRYGGFAVRAVQNISQSLE